MDSINEALFGKINTFQIGSEYDNLSFADRLCRENNWEPCYAQRCIDEYKKFIYLAMTSEHSVTPSDQIDQVWHLHLTYTQSYWNELCSKVLKKPLHHSPTKGGRSESKKYRSQYQATLDSYTSTFGKAPPIDIWPDRQQRFNQADRFVRLNKSDYLLLKKPPKSLLVATTLPLLLAACVNTQISSLTAGTVFSGLLAIAAVYGVYKLITLRKSISPTKNKSNPDVSHSTDPSPDSVRDQNWFARRYAAMMGAYVGFSNNFGGDNGGGGNDSGCGGGCGG